MRIRKTRWKRRRRIEVSPLTRPLSRFIFALDSRFLVVLLNVGEKVSKIGAPARDTREGKKAPQEAYPQAGRAPVWTSPLTQTSCGGEHARAIFHWRNAASQKT